MSRVLLVLVLLIGNVAPGSSWKSAELAAGNTLDASQDETDSKGVWDPNG